VQQLKDGSQNWQDNEIEPGKLSQRRLLTENTNKIAKENWHGWERHLHGVEVPLAYVTVERNPSGGGDGCSSRQGQSFSENGKVR